MKCCGLERDSKFCPKCGKELKEEGPQRWCQAHELGGKVSITIFPDRHRIPVGCVISMEEAAMLWRELGEIVKDTGW